MANNYQQYSTAIHDLTDDERAWVKSLLADPRDPKTGLAQFTEDDYHYCGDVEIHGSTLYLYEMESADIEATVNLIQAFLAKFRPDAYHSFSWANTCSKPRPDEFDGGTVFITATEVRWMNTGQWIREQIAAA